MTTDKSLCSPSQRSVFGPHSLHSKLDHYFFVSVSWIEYWLVDWLRLSPTLLFLTFVNQSGCLPHLFGLYQSLFSPTLPSPSRKISSLRSYSFTISLSFDRTTSLNPIQWENRIFVDLYWVLQSGLPICGQIEALNWECWLQSKSVSVEEWIEQTDSHSSSLHAWENREAAYVYVHRK